MKNIYEKSPVRIKGAKNSTSKPIRYKGKLRIARELAQLPEAELVEGTIRSNITKLEKLAERGLAKLDDASILECMQRVKNRKKKPTKKEVIILSEDELWELFHKLWICYEKY